MNCHQILSGACNAGDRCFAVGSVEGVPFTAYAAGCNIVILASSFERVQIIPGATHGYIKISALDCSTDTGKIAASYDNKICIFEPTPIVPQDKNQSHILDYRWVQTGYFVNDSNVVTLSWNLEGTRLLTGGSSIQLWKEKNPDQQATGVKFTIGGDKDQKSPESEIPSNWETIWSCETAIPVYHMAFNPDGTLFATCGRNDRLVKIWYENKQVVFPTKNSGKQQSHNEHETNYAYVYIAHPRAVTNISWRRTSKYMPKGSVSNMLVTSCLDNICRIWIETVLPDDGLVNMTQFDPLASQNPKFRTQRHKHRFMQRLKHMKTCFHIRRHFKFDENQANSLLNNSNIPGPIPTLPSSCSVHDFHSYGYQSTGVSPGMHFHLAASINAETDIPLVPSMQMLDPSNQNSFILHWVNNKDMHFSLQAEAILQEFAKKVIDDENLLSSVECMEDMTDDAKAKHNRNTSKTASIDDSNAEESIANKYINQLNNVSSLSNTASVNSLNHDHGLFNNKLSDSLEIKIECLLRDWHQGPDLLFAIHPIDGSFLIWVVEWLDDYYPGLFRQAQVSFSTRIPSAFPLGDAMSMSTSVSLYNTGLHPMVFKEIINVKSKGDDCASLKEHSIEEEDQDGDSLNEKESKKDKTEVSEEEKSKEISNMISNIAPAVSMVTKHSNGTLNLWQLTFAFKTKFTQVLSIGHVCRASGHRFRVNDITCHPVLPLLVSTSHHNITDVKKVSASNVSLDKKDVFSTSGFCSELILWRVDAVGPLGYSGGISELARINSPEISAFSNVAWIPTLLPSTTLGNFSNSPSACFVASDGENLRVYQAVIDARTLLAEISSENLNKLHKSNSLNSIYSNASSILKGNKLGLSERLKVVSQQSTARPGCIIELDIISDAKHDWQNTQFLHVFQSQLITGHNQQTFSGGLSNNPNNPNDPKKPNNNTTTSFGKGNLDAIVDLQRTATFQEPFFIVIIEKTLSGSTLHMWRIVISSKEQSKFASDAAMYVPDSNLVQDVDEGGEGVPLKNTYPDEKSEEVFDVPQISILTEKVCTQDLPLPEGVDVIHASPAAGHLSSSSIYPACFAPYIIVTACSDSISRFWKCETDHSYDINNEVVQTYSWSEWKMFSKDHDSSIEISGQPLNISAAYSGRIACAYKYGKSFTRPHKGDSESRYVNLCVGIYECESTGGSEWVLEDTIHLKNIHLPRINTDLNKDLNYLLNSKLIQKKQRINQVFHSFQYDEIRTPRSGETTPDAVIKSPTSILAVPSFSTLQSLRKNIAENGNTCPLTQKHLVQLDWVSKEDGSHILTVAVGSKILLYTQVSSDVAQANIKAMKESRSVNRPILRKASSLVQPHFTEEIRWMKLRQIDLNTADGLPPLPMQISWVRDGILVVAMDSEMHVYSQWKPKFESKFAVEDVPDTRNLRDEDLRSLVNENNQFKLKSVTSMSLINKMSTNNLQLLSSNDKKRKATSVSLNAANDVAPNDDYMTDMGLFQASRIACPVLPQYHPKQLMELLNSGKIRWVKAILSHLVRCISKSSMASDVQCESENPNRQRSWSRSRALSVSYVGELNITAEHRGSTTQITEELMLDYDEIASIPPLPLWMLLNADKEDTSNMTAEQANGYDELFEVNAAEDDDLDDLLIEGETKKNERRMSHSDKQHISYFGPRQGQQLSRFLTHTHLPGLSSLDQMHLLALADTVSTCNTDFSDKFMSEQSKNNFNKENTKLESLDDCGLRFLLAMKHFTYLMRCLPLSQRAQFQKQGIGTSNIVWAFHSENEEELLNLIPSYTKGELKWASLRELGVGFWIKNLNTLRICFEKLAKSAYQAKQDPLDAALYYLAMKKKSIVWGLFRSKRDEKMTTFFSNNFNEDRWRKAALKNAFVLLGKQRFDHAVAFFLLANSLNDAIEVCINKLEDFQLALIIARLYEGDIEISATSTYRKLLCERVLGHVANEEIDMSKAHPDPFLRSITYWILKKYQDSLSTLLAQDVGLQHNDLKEEDILKHEGQGTNPNVFNFYRYLRTHPLLVRQNIALTAQEKKISQVVISGFSHSNETQLSENEKQLLIEDSITPVERQLYFTTAYAHFKAGCPALALDVLNKLPFKVTDSSSSSAKDTKDKEKENLINTGMFNWGSSFEQSKANDFDWSAPITKDEPDEFKIQWDDEDKDKDEDEEDDDDDDVGTTFGVKKPPVEAAESAANGLDATKKQSKMDIMAQQLKFVACLKILMEELSTLATGFEVDGGHLRYQLYVWLEKEVEALTQLCNYCDRDNMEPIYDENNDNKDADMNLSLDHSGKLSLHDILLLEKMDFEAKVKRAARRKRWLKSNETLLRTLLSYCSLHGASGGGLASVRMEIILLLQELQQDKTQQQLLSPLPFPTTLPLLSACVAGNKTVIADPIKYLQAQTVDMLQTVIRTSSYPGEEPATKNDIFLLRDLAIALSSCIYQSLCDSETFVIKKTAMSPYELFAKFDSSFECSHLIGSSTTGFKKRKLSTDETATICTSPSKWPGVTNLRALLAREKDDDIPKLNVLLLESFVATYMALACYSLAIYDTRILYRLVSQNFSNATWSMLFGGGVKKLLRKATSQNHLTQMNQVAAAAAASAASATATDETPDDNSSMWSTVTAITKQRVKLNMKLLGNFANSNIANSMKEDKPTYREQFIPPEMSMLSYLLLKPTDIQVDCDDFDTDDEDNDSQNEDDYNNEDEDDEDLQKNLPAKDKTEHTNPDSYSWCILKTALIKMISKKIQDFANTAGVEVQDLPVLSPLSHEILRTLSRWEEIALSNLIAKGPAPPNYIPGCYIDTGTVGPKIHKYRSILNKENTPFVENYASGPIRRLWNYLVRQEPVQDIFIKSIFGKKPEANTKSSKHVDETSEDTNSVEKDQVDHIRIIHKDHESIQAFCVNNNGNGLIAIANPREIQELDISLLLESPNWYEDECDYDFLNLSKDAAESQTNSTYLMMHNHDPAHEGGGLAGLNDTSGNLNSQSGRGTSLILKHKVDNVKKMSAHPFMPLYLTGGQDGSVQIWEWGHKQVICTPRPSGTFAKVTRCRFSDQGNKFGIADGDGNLSLWQAAMASQNNRPFFTYQCHNKVLSDFVFLGSCSLMGSAGQSSENKNVNIWDTLLPQKKACVSAFTCHEQGASCLAFAPQHQLLLSCGKKGDVCIFDIRQRSLKHRFVAHESAIKCIAIDPHEEFFATASIEGDIKIWDFTHYTILNTFAGEHSKNSFFKHMGQGVNQLHIDSFGRLFSCGADGCMKVRMLIDKDPVFHTPY